MMSLKRKLFNPINILPLVYLRVVFGGMMLWEVWRYFDHGWISRYFIEPTYFFNFYGFGWLRPWPGEGMMIHFAVMGLLAACIALGLAYRLSAGLFFLAFTYIFLLDQTRYLNHFYLICILSFLMIFIPAHRAYSLDAWLRPNIRSRVAPTWALWLLRGQIGLVYFFAGVAKINPDWLAGEPMRDWLSSRTYFPVIGQWFAEEWMVYGFSYGGLLLDLFAFPLLLWRRTRWFAIGLLLVFHLTNYGLFNIGVFPWLMIALLPLYLDPALFDRLLPKRDTHDFTRRRGVIFAVLAVYFAVQIMLPLRHWVYPGDVAWTEEGHYFSWRMKLRSKDPDLTIYLTDQATGTRWPLELTDYLTHRQIDDMGDHPRMIVLFAHDLHDLLAEQGREVTVSAWALAELNGHPPSLLIDPSVDLSQVAVQPFYQADWILPREGSTGWR